MSDTQRTITGTFELAVNLTDRRTFKMTGYTYSDDTITEVNARVDLAQEVMDRQVVRCDIQNKEAQIEQHTLNLENIRENMEGLVELSKGGKKLTSQQKQSLDNYEPTIKQAQKMIDSLKSAIKQGKQKLNGAAHV
jgi:peptidoglycan hydrolase CwlO-like protein